MASVTSVLSLFAVSCNTSVVSSPSASNVLVEELKEIGTEKFTSSRLPCMAAVRVVSETFAM